MVSSGLLIRGASTVVVSAAFPCVPELPPDKFSFHGESRLPTFSLLHVLGHGTARTNIFACMYITSDSPVRWETVAARHHDPALPVPAEYWVEP